MPAETVVFGAGRLGKKIAAVVAPVLFCDNNPSLWGSRINGIPVESPMHAAENYRDATFIVAIWHPSRTECMVDRLSQIRSLGARNVISFTELLKDCPDAVLPHFFWERSEFYKGRRDEIDAARNLLDAAGREEFDRQMRLRNADHTGQAVDPGVQYFPHDSFRLTKREVFVDCGAYNGDTIHDFRAEVGDRFEKILAFEPDPTNFVELEESFKSDPRVQLFQYATGARRETLCFTSDGTGSHLSSSGQLKIQVAPLDEILRDESPTYLKFDIEGAEPDALEGAREVIARCRPKLAVCVYHCPDHLWQIPVQMNKLRPDSRLTMRTYNADGLDCVCYAY